jgi:hypothetical protein
MSGPALVLRSILAAYILATSSSSSFSATIDAKADTFVDVRVEGRSCPEMRRG